MNEMLSIFKFPFGFGEYEGVGSRMFLSCVWVWGSCSSCEKAYGVCDLQVLSHRRAESPTGRDTHCQTYIRSGAG